MAAIKDKKKPTLLSLRNDLVETKAQLSEEGCMLK